MKHTPGPWKVNGLEFSKRPKCWIGAPSNDPNANKAGFMKEIADIHGHHKEYKANAKLIEAAPELLEMLKALADPSLDRQVHQEEIAKAKELIKRIEED